VINVLLHRMRAIKGVLVLAVLVLSGCTSIREDSPKKGGEQEWVEGDAFTFQPPQEVMATCPVLDCGSYGVQEPSIAFSPAGALAADARGSLARSTDGGESWIRAHQPDIVRARLTGQWVPLDALVQSDGRGRIWYTMMQADRLELNRDPRILGLQIYRTADAGITWDLSVNVTVPWAGELEPDRQWLVFADEFVVLSFQGFGGDPGGHVMVSGNDGRTWEGPFKTAPRAQHGRGAWANGLILPFTAADSLGFGAWVALSSDGKQWEQVEVSSTPAAAEVSVVSTSPSGRVWYAWTQRSISLKTDELQVAYSDDSGRSWSEPLGLARLGKDVTRGLWMSTKTEVVHIAYFEDGGPCCGGILHVIKLEEGEIHRAIAASQLVLEEPFTDFAFVEEFGGKVFTIYPDGKEKIWLAWHELEY
jgi:hypothetical protein